jgi:hypothetical protein
LVLLAGIPWLASKLIDVFDPSREVRAFRWIAGCTVGLGLLIAFYPGAAVAAAVLLVVTVLVPPFGEARRRGLSHAVAGFAGAAVLSFPVTLALLRDHGSGLADRVGPATFESLARLVVSAGPGGWTLSFYLPVAAALSLLFVSGRALRIAGWALVLALSGMGLGWLAAAERLPDSLANPVAFTALTAFGYAALVALGLASVIEGVATHAFGHRQLGGALLIAAVAVGLFGQIVQTGRGSWEVGDAADMLPDAYPVVAGAPGGAYRVLWVGGWSGGALTVPGGIPDARVEAGHASIRYAVTSPAGASSLDVGRPASGPGYERLNGVLTDILAGETRHGGALLSPFGIRYLVGDPNDLPRAAVRRLAAQLDLDMLPAGGLVVFRVFGTVPLPSVAVGPEWLAAARHPSFVSVAALPPATNGEKAPADTVSGQKLVLVSQQFDSRWKLEGQPGSDPPLRAFGWAIGFATTTGSPADVRFEGQGLRDAEVVLLALLWLGALWAIRRPASRG